MANKPSKIKIDVSKIDKAHLFKGEKGTYLNVAVWENREGPDKWGNTHYLTQEISQEARESGVKAPIIGNMKLESGISRPAPRGNAMDEHNRNRQSGRTLKPQGDPSPDDGDEIPF